MLSGTCTVGKKLPQGDKTGTIRTLLSDHGLTQRRGGREKKKAAESLHSFAVGSQKRTEAFFFLLAASIILFSIISVTMNGDDYFMIANWRAFLREGFYIRDPLSMHSNYRCSLEKWMSCAIVWFLYTKTGIIGLKAVLAAFEILIAFFLFRLCVYTSGNRTMSWIFTDLMLLTGRAFLQIRPQTATTLLLILETLCLEHYMREGKAKWLIPLPFLSWLEMQLHSTIWPCFFLVLLPYLADCGWTEKKLSICWQQKRDLLAAGILSFGALFLNPYGAWSVFYIFRSYGDSFMSKCINELHPTALDIPEWTVWLIVFGVTMAVGDKKAPVRYWLLYLGFFVFGWMARRNIIFTCLLAGFVPCWMLRDFNSQIRWNLLPIAPLFLVAAVISGQYSYSFQLNNADDIDIKALDWLSGQKSTAGSRIFCDFNSGSYAEYLGFHPYMDTRAEVYLKKVNGVEELMGEYYRLSTGHIYYRDFTDKYHFDFLVVNKNVNPGLYLDLQHDSDFRMIYQPDTEGVQQYAVFAQYRN